MKRLVFASSSSVYGNSPTLPEREDMPTNPLSPYAVSKLAGESYCRVFYQVYGLPTVALRYFNVFGPRQDSASQYSAVIPKFITAMLQGESPTIYGNGLQSRDFTYVTNVVNACLLSCQEDHPVGRAINIATGGSISLLDLVNELNLICASNVLPSFVAPRAGDVQHSWADTTLAHELLGYKPVVGFGEGLRAVVSWFKTQQTQ